MLNGLNVIMYTLVAILALVFFLDQFGQLGNYFAKNKNKEVSKTTVDALFKEPKPKLVDKLLLWGLDERAIFGGINIPVIEKVVGEELHMTVVWWLAGGIPFKNPPPNYTPAMTVDEAINQVRQETKIQDDEWKKA